jgi:hypothetical protein
MAIKEILGALKQARSVAKRTPIRSLEEATLEGARRAVAREAAATGIVREARDLERAADRVAAETREFRAIERRIVAQRPGLRASADLIGSVTTAPLSRLETLFRRFNTRERLELGERALRLARGKSVKEALRAENNMAGQLREVVSKYLPEVMDEVGGVHRQLRQQTVGSATRSVIDSANHGAVELPTRLRGKDRFIRLGTDRIVGIGHVAPQRVSITWSDGTHDLIEVAGELDVSLAVEIKGRTTATGGIEQLRALQQRGRQGYAIIGDRFWLLRYEPADVFHLAVAPPGEELIAAKKMASSLSAQGLRSKVVAIPLDLDDDVKTLARNYLIEAASIGPSKP